MKALLHLLLILSAFGLCAPGLSADSSSATAEIKGQRVFTSGHSLLMLVPALLKEVAASARIHDHTSAGVQSVGGSPVSKHWDLDDARNKVKPALRSGAVDVLMLSPICLPDDGIEKLAALGLEHNPKLRVSVQEFWIPYDDPTVLKAGAGPKVVERDRRTMAEQRQMHAAYFQSMDDHLRALNTKFGKQALFVVPVGQAVMALRGKIIEGTAPGLKTQNGLFRDGLGHARPVVQVLSTYCHFAVICRRNPAGMPVARALRDQPVAEPLNRPLQQLAWDAVTEHPLSGVEKN